MRICPDCGEDVPSTVRLCRRCGYDFTLEVDSVRRWPARDVASAFVALLGVVVTLAAGLWAFFGRDQTSRLLCRSPFLPVGIVGRLAQGFHRFLFADDALFPQVDQVSIDHAGPFS